MLDHIVHVCGGSRDRVVYIVTTSRAVMELQLLAIEILEVCRMFMRKADL